MAISKPYEGSVTVGTSEISLVSGTTSLSSITTAGIVQGFLDLSNLAAGDSYKLRIKEKVLTSGTQREISSLVVNGPVDSPVLPIPSFILANGWDITMVKLAGTNRSIDYSIRQVS